MEEHIHMEYETNLSQAFFRVTVAEPYTEDYQMPMLQRNPIDGILPIEGVQVNGASCYTYGVGGCASMSDLYAKDCMKKADIQELIGRLLEVIEILQKHMLNPDCLMLEPSIFFGKQENGGSVICRYKKKNCCSLFMNCLNLCEDFRL